MSSRVLLKPQKVMDAVVADQNRTSLVTNVNMISLLSYTIAWGNSVTGDFDVEVSNDYIAPVGVQPEQIDSGTWVPVTLSTPVSASGTADTAFIDVALTGAAYIRLKFTDTSGGAGTGTITATLAGKVS
jgi:hypothetical protein